MSILNFIRKKYIRLQGSRNTLKLNYFIEKYFRDKKLGNIGFDFSNKPSRQSIVQEIINIKKYKSYLEIGTFHNELFDHIKCDIKIGVDPVSGGTVRKTSDQFFKDNQDKFDCIFIDGLHFYSQVQVYGRSHHEDSQPFVHPLFGTPLGGGIMQEKVQL